MRPATLFFLSVFVSVLIYGGIDGIRNDPPLHAYVGTDAIFSIAGGVTHVGYTCVYDPSTRTAAAPLFC